MQRASIEERIGARAASPPLPPIREANGGEGSGVGGVLRASAARFAAAAAATNARPPPLTPPRRSQALTGGGEAERPVLVAERTCGAVSDSERTRLLRALKPELAHQGAPLLLLGLDVGAHALDRGRVE